VALSIKEVENVVSVARLELANVREGSVRELRIYLVVGCEIRVASKRIANKNRRVFHPCSLRAEKTTPGKFVNWRRISISLTMPRS